MPSLVKIGLVILETKMKIWKVYRQTYGQTDDGQQRSEKLIWAFGSGELKTTKIKTNPFNVIVIKIQIPAFYSLITCTKPKSNWNCYSPIRETSWDVWRGTDDPPCRVCPSSGNRYKITIGQGQYHHIEVGICNHKRGSHNIGYGVKSEWLSVA